MSSAPRHHYGITLHASSYRPLLGLLNLDETTFRRCVAVDGAVGGSGHINPQTVMNPGAANSHYFRAHRGRLEQLLREGLDIKWEQAVQQVEQTPSGTVLRFQDCRRVESGCVIGADGPHSHTRQCLLPDTDLDVLPIVAYNGKRRVERAMFDNVYAPFMKGSNVLETKLKDAVMNVSLIERKDDFVDMSWTYSRALPVAPTTHFTGQIVLMQKPRVSQTISMPKSARYLISKPPSRTPLMRRKSGKIESYTGSCALD
jgi:2-polyprenyl-6-methoxyphenol hydroxylase-like FAD-dependent oxidoreductase